MIYQHLRGPLRHAPECNKKCAAGCPVAAFEAALEAPVLGMDRTADERRQQRVEALMRGEIPA